MHAVDRQNEKISTPGVIYRVGKIFADENIILNLTRSQLTAANADAGIFGLLGLGEFHIPAAVFAQGE